MNPFTNLLKPEAEARLRSEIGSISGVAILRITAVPPANINTMRLMEVCVKLTGWSGSLNHLLMHWRTSIGIDYDAGTQICELMLRFDAHMDAQRDRLAQGLALGTAAPFGVSDMDGTREDTKWAHILVDRGLAALLERRREGDFDREVSNSVFDLHQDDHGERDGLETELVGDTEDDDGTAIGEHALFGRELRHDVEVGPGVVFNGEVLTIERTMPETVVAAAIGRPLGAFITVPDEIADREIIASEQADARVMLRVRPDLELAGVLLAEIEAAQQTT